MLLMPLLDHLSGTDYRLASAATSSQSINLEEEQSLRASSETTMGMKF